MLLFTFGDDKQNHLIFLFVIFIEQQLKTLIFKVLFLNKVILLFVIPSIETID